MSLFNNTPPGLAHLSSYSTQDLFMLRQRNFDYQIKTCLCLCHFFCLPASAPSCRACWAYFYIRRIWFRVALHSGDTGLSFLFLSATALLPRCCCPYRGYEGLKNCRLDWEMGHIICPWNILWHNMSLGHFYVKVNMSPWRLDKSGQAGCQFGFLFTAEKRKVLQHRLEMKCACGTFCASLCIEHLVHKCNPHRHKSPGLGYI